MKHFEDLEFIAGLFIKELQDSSSEEEKLLLANWKLANPSQAEQLQLLLSSGDLFSTLQRLEAADSVIRNRLMEANVPINIEAEQDCGLTKENLFQEKNEQLINEGAGGYATAPTMQRAAHRVHFLRRGWFRYAAAVILLVGIGIYLHKNQPAKAVAVEERIVQDVPAPTINRATLTLANGQIIFLDSADNGILAMEGKTNIHKTEEGDIVYQGKNTVEDLQFNTVLVPKGSRVASIILSDGTRVFLNAASSLKYPVAFNSVERSVEIIGEAYFQVAKEKQRPFVVRTSSTDVTVLGTEFNVNSYVDETSVKISLVQGSVKVEEKILKPGEAFVNGNVVKIDIEQDISWQKGMFVFSNMNLQSILRQVSRWYNVEVVYKENVPSRNFGGTLSRRSSLSDVVKMLVSNDVPSVIEGSKLIIGN